MSAKAARQMPPKVKQGLVITLYVTWCILALGGGTLAGWVSTSGFLSRNGGILGAFFYKHAPEVFQKNSVNILVLGCDEDRLPGGAVISKGKARSDMMMLVHMDFATKTVSGLSIPRDTLFNLESYDEYRHKINAFHSYGGSKLATEAVTKMLGNGLHIDRTVDLDFDGLEEMVDLVDGVTLNIDKNMDYDDHAGHLSIHFKKGVQHLNGQKSMEFVRFRHSDSDFKRADRQHQFMFAFKDALVHHGQALPQVIDTLAKMLSDGLNETEVNALGHFVFETPSSHIRFGQIPILEEGSNVLPNNAKMQSVLKDYGFIAGAKS